LLLVFSDGSVRFDSAIGLFYFGNGGSNGTSSHFGVISFNCLGDSRCDGRNGIARLALEHHVPDIFGIRQITFWEAFRLMLIAALLFGGPFAQIDLGG